MAATIQLPPLLLFFAFSSPYLPLSTSQSASQNIQVFYPFPFPLPPPPPPPSTQPSNDTTTPTPTHNSNTNKPRSNSSRETVGKAVGATVAATLVLSGLLFLLFVKYKRERKGKENTVVEIGNTQDPVMMLNNRFTRVEAIKGVIVDEEGLDVLYWRKLDLDENDDNNGYGNKRIVFKKDHLKNDHIQEVPLLRGKSSSSHVWPLEENKSQNDDLVVNQKSLMKSQRSSRSPPPTPPLPPPPQVVVEGKSYLPPPPPEPPKTDGLTLSSSSKEPPPPVKLKPLHWEKVNANVGHPTAWDKMDDGSFRFDGDLMEAMFGTVVANKKPTQQTNNSSTPKTKPKSGPPSQRFILETHRSQNISIILRSLLVSRQEIIDCLLEGQGLNTETLEKLTKIRPTKEEQHLILNYDQDITRLANAESFLYHVLRAVPTAFTRFDTMFFRLTYTSEVSEIKNMLQTLETACKELRTRGLFVKLLEAVLKAGNRMNAGTSRGNAQAFSMNSLLKLSDVKSCDGKATLLHFVVEEVVRLEGKRCMINQKTGSLTSDASRDCIKLGLPVVGGVSSEFTNVKKAAGIDYDIVFKSCLGLSDSLVEITKTMQECGFEGDGFVREMERFVERAEREIRVLREEQERVIGLVKKTNEYYRAGASKDKGRKQFQLFVIVKGFLDMVDKACVDIAVNLQKGRYSGVPEAETVVSDRPKMKFPVLPANFISSSSSDSDEDEDL